MANLDNNDAGVAGKRLEPCGASMAAISAFAERIAGALGLKPGDDLEPVVKRLRGSIRELPGDKANKGKATITVKEDGGFVIQLLSLFPLPLQTRVSIAHELGHYFLHSRCGKVPIGAPCDAGGDETAENEAHEFACAFLMPAELLRRVAKKFGGDSFQVAAYFMVPEPFAQQRMQDVGC